MVQIKQGEMKLQFWFRIGNKVATWELSLKYFSIMQPVEYLSLWGFWKTSKTAVGVVK